MKPAVYSAILVLSLLAAGCGGGGSASNASVIPVATSPLMPSSGSARVALQIPTAATAAARARKPAFVSPATMSATIAVAGTTTVLDLSPSSPSCSTQPSGRICAANVNVAFGNVTFVVTTYGRAPVNGAVPSSAHVLGTGSVTQSVSVTSSAVSIAIDAVVNGLGTLASFGSWPADGVTHTYGFVLNPVDFDNQPIQNHANDPFANPISVTLTETGGSGHAHLQLNGNAIGTNAMLHSAADSVSIVYDGGGTTGYSASIAFAANGLSTITTTRSPLYVSSVSQLYSPGFLSLHGASSNATMTISEANAPGGLTYSATPVSCTNIATTTQPVLQSGVQTFVVTGGTQPSNGGCVIGVSDGISLVNIGVVNLSSATPTPTPSPAPTPTTAPTATPTPTPATTPSPTPTPTATPLVTPSPLPASVYISNGGNAPWLTFPISGITGASPSPYNAAPATQLNATSGFSAYFALDYAHNILWSNNGAVYGFPASWNGSIAPIKILSPTIGSGSGGIAVDPAGDVYVSVNNFPTQYIEIFAYGSTTPTTTVTTTLQNCGSLAIDAPGNIYCIDRSTHSFNVIAAPGVNAGSVAGTTTRTISAGLTNPWNVAVDSSGRVYVVDPGVNTVDIFAAGTTNAASSTPIEGIAGGGVIPSTPNGIAIDASDNVFVASISEVEMFTAGSINANVGFSLNYASGGKISGASTLLSNAAGIVAH